MIFTPGSHTALYLVCQALLEVGDDLLLPEPYYAAYDPVFTATGARVVHVVLRPEDQFHVQLANLEAALTPSSKALVLNNPHNPTGSVLTPQRVREVAEFCRDHGLWLISDEVYEDLVYEGTFASPFDLADCAEGVAVVSSVSKSHAMTGWRCGWAVGSAELISRGRQIAEAMMFGMQPFLQDAAAFALTEEFEECATMREDYRRRAGLVAHLFAEVDEIDCLAPQAGIFVMLDIRATGLDGLKFAGRLLDEKSVATMPGESFGPSAAGHIRVSLTAGDESLITGCERIVGFARKPQ